MPQFKINPKVVDIYWGDSVSTWSKVKKAGILGIIHKASQGTHMVDKKYESRMEGAKKAGLLWGAYHFANDEDPKAQVKSFLAAAKVTAADKETLVCLDWEPNKNHTMTSADARIFLKEVEQILGRKAVLYSGNRAKEALGDKEDEFFGSHRLWLCQYGPKWRTQASWEKPWLWQFTGDGMGPSPHWIDGITCPGNSGIDINSYDGTDEQLVKEWAS